MSPGRHSGDVQSPDLQNECLEVGYDHPVWKFHRQITFWATQNKCSASPTTSSPCSNTIAKSRVFHFRAPDRHCRVIRKKKVLAITSNHELFRKSKIIKNASRSSELAGVKVPCSQGGPPPKSSGIRSTKYRPNFESGLTCTPGPDCITTIFYKNTPLFRDRH